MKNLEICERVMSPNKKTKGGFAYFGGELWDKGGKAGAWLQYCHAKRESQSTSFVCEHVGEGHAAP